MKSITHLKTFGVYAKGKSSSWPDHIADDYVHRGFAIYMPIETVKPEPVIKPPIAPIRRGPTERMIKKKI